MNIRSTSLLIVYSFILWVLFQNFSLNSEDWIHFSDFSIAESWKLARDSYNLHNGRIGELIGYFTGPYALDIYHIVTPLSILICLLSGLKIATNSWVPTTGAQRFISLTLFLGILSIHAGISWFIGNLNWFYPVTLAIFFFALYEGLFRGETQLSCSKFLLMLPLAFIIGMSNENTSCTAVATYLVTGAYWAYRQKKRPAWSYWILGIAMIMGAYFLYTAPGPKLRSLRFGWELSLETLLFDSFLQLTNWIYLAICYWRLWVVLILLIVLCLAKRIQFISVRTIILTVACLFSQGVLLAAPMWGAPRSYTLPEVLTVIIIAQILYDAIRHGLNRRESILVLAIHAICAATMMVPLVLKAYAHHNMYAQIEHMAECAKKEGKTSLVIHAHQLNTSPVASQIPNVPRFIMNTEVVPEYPLLGIKEDKFHSMTNVNVQGDFPYVPEGTPVNLGRRVLNIPMARRMGLDSIILLLPDQEEKP